MQLDLRSIMTRRDFYTRICAGLSGLSGINSFSFVPLDEEFWRTIELVVLYAAMWTRITRICVKKRTFTRHSNCERLLSERTVVQLDVLRFCDLSENICRISTKDLQKKLHT